MREATAERTPFAPSSTGGKSRRIFSPLSISTTARCWAGKSCRAARRLFLRRPRSSAKLGRLACWHGLRESAATSPCARLRGFHCRCDHVGSSSTSARARSATRACPMGTCKPSSRTWGSINETSSLKSPSASPSRTTTAFERQIRYYVNRGSRSRSTIWAQATRAWSRW